MPIRLLLVTLCITEPNQFSRYAEKKDSSISSTVRLSAALSVLVVPTSIMQYVVV